MTEAVGAILDFGFGPMGLHSVEAQIEPATTGSRRVLEKLGFVQEGYFRENFFFDGMFGDTAVFSLLKRNWRQARGDQGLHSKRGGFYHEGPKMRRLRSC